ncbi:multidrug transporter [Caballeronia udeis]|uniref:Multidrug transporter n=1 Tax=Caballeronia udeis TaxID=1232866 RepID=A0A158HTD4_9BURK|nr:multidrug transporter [Caballeronia udeis]
MSSLPIFYYGSKKVSLDVAKIEKNIGIADYESAIQTAFNEILRIAHPFYRG